MGSSENLNWVDSLLQKGVFIITISKIKITRISKKWTCLKFDRELVFAVDSIVYQALSPEHINTACVHSTWFDTRGLIYQNNGIILCRIKQYMAINTILH